MNIVKQNLVDCQILSFFDWRTAIEKEDKEEFGCLIRRAPKDWFLLYDIYVKFQTSDNSNVVRELYSHRAN